LIDYGVVVKNSSTSEAELYQIPRRLEMALVIGIIFVAVILRVIALRSSPPGLRYDELVNATGVDQILREGPTIYLTSSWGHEPLFQHVVAFMWVLIGRSAFTFRLTAALFGILGVIAGWLLARRLFGSWVALLGAAALATTFVPLYFGRLALRVISLPLFTALTAYALWQAIDPESEEAQGGRPYLWFILGGITLGLALLTYPASRVLPFSLLAFVIYLAIFHRETLRDRWLGLCLYFGLAAVIAGTMFLYLQANPEAEQRYQQLSGGLASLGVGDVGPLITGVRQTLEMFILQGESAWIYNIAKRPYFSLPVGILFFLGVALAIWRWRKPAYALALFLLVGGLIPGMVSITDPGFRRIINTLPVVYVFPALVLMASANWASRRWEKQRKLIAALVAGLAMIYFASDIYAYFGVWVPHPEAQVNYGPEMLQLAEYLEAHPEIESAAISTPGVTYFDPWDRIQMGLLLGRDLAPRWFNGATSLIIPAVDGPVTYYLHYNSPLDDDWWPLLDAGSAGDVDGGEVPAFTPYVLLEPKKAIEQLLASNSALDPVQLGGIVTFRGGDVLEDSFSPGETIHLRTVWQADNVPNEPTIVYVHLLNDAGEWVAGWDKLDVAPESWGAGDVFALNHTLAIPADAPLGTYHINVGWYSPVTGTRLLIVDGDDHIPLGEVKIGGQDG
jgi:4-amino-4-deoxy-L-arabinose transferase-like glycosyltransferase